MNIYFVVARLPEFVWAYAALEQASAERCRRGFHQQPRLNVGK